MKMAKPTMQTVRFGAQDVIATSVTFTLANIGDRTKKNATFKSSDGKLNFDASTVAGDGAFDAAYAAMDAINAYFGSDSNYDIFEDRIFDNGDGGSGANVSLLFGTGKEKGDSTGNDYASYAGVYTWDKVNKNFVWKYSN